MFGHDGRPSLCPLLLGEGGVVLTKRHQNRGEGLLKSRCQLRLIYKYTGGWPIESRLASRYLYLVAQLLQHIRDLLPLFALDLDHAFFDRPTCATFLF